MIKNEHCESAILYDAMLLSMPHSTTTPKILRTAVKMVPLMLIWLVISAFLFVTPVAHAEAFGLVCSGTITVYEPNRMEGNVPAGATTVDLGGHALSTPVGTFRIVNVGDRMIAFFGSDGPLKASGTIDRFAGDLNVIWVRPE